MWKRAVLSLSVLTFVLVVPLLEVNETHVFNPAWPEHARLHEVWQLITNVAVGLICLWLAWFGDRVREASLLGLTVTGGFLAAYFIRTSYGGSMRHTDGSELMVFGINAAVLTMAAAFFALAIIAWSGSARCARNR